jgi:hypothetical protein
MPNDLDIDGLYSQWLANPDDAFLKWEDFEDGLRAAFNAGYKKGWDAGALKHYSPPEPGSTGD